MDPMSRPNASSLQKTPGVKTEKEKTPVDKKKEKKTSSEIEREQEKERAEKKIEDQRRENKEQQARDLPRFKVGEGENEITTSKDTYELISCLGQGSFGCVFSCVRQSDKKSFAIKCESVHARKPMLPHEANVLLALNLLKSPHFVEMIDNGQIAGRFQFVVIRLVGQNLWDVRVEMKEKRFTLATSLMIGIQTLAGLRDLHRKEQSRKDDIESWWYMLTEFIVFDIPWKKIRGTDRDGVRAAKWRLRGDGAYMKMLFHKCCYQQMHTILLYLDSLQYGNIPDYDFIYHQVTAAASVHKAELEAAPDWDQKAKRYGGPEYKERVAYIVKELE
uniref:Protein kinase domain-containing protein n=1 Tax=Caenorhabditis tropicalis TaxID=1561998 RepID=A0A1I7TWW2_9PELO